MRGVVFNGGLGRGMSACEDEEVVKVEEVWVVASFTFGFGSVFGSNASRQGVGGGEVGRADSEQDWGRAVASVTVGFVCSVGPDAVIGDEEGREVLEVFGEQ